MFDKCQYIDYYQVITKAQRKSLHGLWQRNNNGMSYRNFRKSAKIAGCGNDNWLGVIWCNMYVGIENDGYTHT
jgi:hypothetical protein